MVDLRSDTVTRPSAAMWEAMGAAPLGDDVLGDDPTVQALESACARLTGKEAAVFVPSGTMGNQIAIAAHTRPGDSVLVEDEAHILYYEVGAPAVLSGVTLRAFTAEDGIPSVTHLDQRRLVGSLHTPGTTLLCLENTHNRRGGAVIPPAAHAEIADWARAQGMKVHCDGARIFNAATACGVPVREFTQHLDSITFCLSKALGAPVGSVLCGSAEFIDRARVWRKRLGGGMRQSGLLAAAGLYALEHTPPDLLEDHRRARELAAGIRTIPGWHAAEPATNIVLAQTPGPASPWAEKLNASGIGCFPFGPQIIRFVTHRDIDDAGIAKTLSVLREIAGQGQAG